MTKHSFALFARNIINILWRSDWLKERRNDWQLGIHYVTIPARKDAATAVAFPQTGELGFGDSDLKTYFVYGTDSETTTLLQATVS